MIAIADIEDHPVPGRNDYEFWEACLSPSLCGTFATSQRYSAEPVPKAALAPSFAAHRLRRGLF